MGRVVYVPYNDKIWFDYYLEQARQTGHGFTNGFEGLAFQRGNGLGSFFGRLFRSILPVAKKVGKAALKTVGKEALNMGANVMSDVAEGANVKQALRQRGKTAGKNLLRKTATAVRNQSGGRVGKRTVVSTVSPVPAKKRKLQQLKKKSNKKTQKRFRPDIF